MKGDTIKQSDLDVFSSIDRLITFYFFFNCIFLYAKTRDHTLIEDNLVSIHAILNKVCRKA